MADDRQWLVKYLNDQARHLQALTVEALRDPDDSSTPRADAVRPSRGRPAWSAKTLIPALTFYRLSDKALARSRVR
jgi:hypothetical protein